MSSLSRQFYNLNNTSERQDERGIVFINANFDNCDTLIQQIVPELRVIVVSPHAQGIQEVSRILDTSCCQEIYIIAQGSPGCLYLGSTELSLNTLINHSSELQSWFQNPADVMLDDRRLYLYGSDVAAGDVGEEFITKLSSIVGATIAASAKVAKSHVLQP
ncbi:MAG: DUF4347 domain-containing protein [Cyanobacteria bacterium P01_G01_bin.67]